MNREWAMRLKVVLGLIVVAAATGGVCAPPAAADQTGLASIHTLRREGGRLCMADHFHYGSSGFQRSRGAAQQAAIRSWQDFTDLEYGSDWARFSRAASKGMKCSGGSGGWTCDASGRPCR
jgi:hypothetical protein